MINPTPDEVRMKMAGKKMDAWAHLFVKGIPLNQTKLGKRLGWTPTRDINNERIPDYSAPDGMTTGATWLLVEAIFAQDVNFFHEWNFRCHKVVFFKQDVLRIEVEAPTAPLAITRAAILCALTAKEGQGK